MKQLDLLRAYDAASGIERKPVTLAAVAAIAHMSPATASLANGFFLDVGLLQKGDSGQQFLPAQAVHEFAHTHQWSAEEAPHKLASVLRKSWAYTALEPRLKFSSSLSEHEAVTRLAEVCGASTQYQPQLKLVLSFLEVAGLIDWDGKTIRRRGDGPSVSDPLEDSASGGTTASSEKGTAIAGRSGSNGSGTASGRPEGQIRFAVSVTIDVAELRGWTPDRIATLFTGISQVIAAKGSAGEEDSPDEQ